jgi:deazaflavin-dependent oxidoreductase (nitroreductase family)
MPQEMPDTDSIKAFNESITDEFRANNGKVGGQFEGANLLLLTTTGAKSGQPRVSPLAYFRIDGKLIVIGSFAGADVNPAWVHNLRAHPSAHVESATSPRTSPRGNCHPLNGTNSSPGSPRPRRVSANIRRKLPG